MICERCHVMMKSGTSYENRRGYNKMRFIECPKCHERKYNNSSKFQELFIKTKTMNEE